MDITEQHVSLWWDTKVCCIPKPGEVFSLVQRIEKRLIQTGINGLLNIFAFGDFRNLETTFLKEFESNCIRMHTVSDDDDYFKSIITNLLLWLIDNPPPAVIILFSNDESFAKALHGLRLRNYKIILALPNLNTERNSLLLTANVVWNWKRFASFSAIGLSKSLSNNKSQTLDSVDPADESHPHREQFYLYELLEHMQCNQILPTNENLTYFFCKKYPDARLSHLSFAIAEAIESNECRWKVEGGKRILLHGELKTRSTCIDPDSFENVYDDHTWEEYKSFLTSQEALPLFNASLSRNHLVELIYEVGPASLTSLSFSQLSHLIQLSISHKHWILPRSKGGWSPFTLNIIPKSNHSLSSSSTDESNPCKPCITNPLQSQSNPNTSSTPFRTVTTKNECTVQEDVIILDHYLSTVAEVTVDRRTKITKEKKKKDDDLSLYESDGSSHSALERYKLWLTSKLRACGKEGMDLAKLKSDYLNEYGVDFDHKVFGFSKFKSFLFSLSPLVHVKHYEINNLPRAYLSSFISTDSSLPSSSNSSLPSSNSSLTCSNSSTHNTPKDDCSNTGNHSTNIESGEENGQSQNQSQKALLTESQNRVEEVMQTNSIRTSETSFLDSSFVFNSEREREREVGCSSVTQTNSSVEKFVHDLRVYVTEILQAYPQGYSFDLKTGLWERFGYTLDRKPTGFAKLNKLLETLSDVANVSVSRNDQLIILPPDKK